jgi:acetyl/propionyl-CoA carboxylase alpha subunit/acetyl-CoA carboxylase carboxyltransferase component
MRRDELWIGGLSEGHPDAMSFSRLLVANRGEIAVRIIRAAGEAGIVSVAVYPADDAASQHVALANEAFLLSGAGPAAYLSIEDVIAAAIATGCDAVHPGYGFLSEVPEFAEACEAAGITFVGPTVQNLRDFGDKAAGRTIAEKCNVPVLRGSSGVATIEEAERLLAEVGPGGVMIKAVAGGGGRGMRAVVDVADLSSAWERCRSESLAAFGNGDLLVEELAGDARHVEVQVIGDGTGAVSHLHERECSLQRRHQKLVEIAPAIGLEPTLRELAQKAAVAMASAVNYRGLGTFEFLVFGDRVAFIEANPRLQVEHTITEEITGLDLVRISLELAAGQTLAELGLTQDLVPTPRGFAVQGRINMEQMQPDGSVLPTGGVITEFVSPTGPGVRVDTFAYDGYETSARYDSLLAKVVASGPTSASAMDRAARAVRDLNIGGVGTNAPFIAAILERPEVRTGEVTTRFVEEHLAELLSTVPEIDLGATSAPGTVSAVLQGVVVSVSVAPGDVVAAGAELVVVEALKMEHAIVAAEAGVVTRVEVKVGDAVHVGETLVTVDPVDADRVDQLNDHSALDLDAIRPDLARLQQRRAALLDSARPDAVAKRHAKGRRTGVENVDDLFDDDTFVEYGGLVIAAQRARRPLDELIAKTPRDGVITGTGEVNGERCVVVAYDLTVLAGTQGALGYLKSDRALELAARHRMPVVLFAEGGGGRAGDTDIELLHPSELDNASFRLLAQLSGVVPLVGINAGHCFAGNAVLIGECDVIIATPGSNIGVAGPAMVEAGGMGAHRAETLGTHEAQVRSGAVDLTAEDEADAVRLARKYLSYFQGPSENWTAPDQRLLRQVLPEARTRSYDVRRLIEVLADDDSVLELREQFGQAMVTSLVRIEGRPVGVIANNPMYISGAIDSDAADKAARFLRLCDTFGVPVVSLCDCPGIMVGPVADNGGLVRHASRTMLAVSTLSVPVAAIITRRAYGIGGMVMLGGHSRGASAVVAWPSAELGPMGHEGTIRLSHGDELAAIEDPKERARRLDGLVAELYERGGAINVASAFEIDDVIDPAETRKLIMATFNSGLANRPPKQRPFLDVW